MLLSLVQALGLDASCVPRIATGFGGGMSRQGQACGAVTGGIMALGLKYGRTSPEDAGAKEDAYRLTADFVQAIRDRFGGVGCAELLGCDIGTPEGMAEVTERNLHTEVCERVVVLGAQEAYRLIADRG